MKIKVPRRMTMAAAGALLVLGILGGAPLRAAETTTAVSFGPNSLHWTSLVPSSSMTLRIGAPDGRVHTMDFGANEAPVLSLYDAAGQPLADGTYGWELRIAPQAHHRRNRGRSRVPLIDSGYFTILEGAFVSPDLTETEPARGDSPEREPMTSPSQTVSGNLTIDGKTCIGLGCPANESFDDDTLRLKQSVVRLRFMDTSVQAGFANADWQLTVNDTGSTNAANRFSIQDLSALTTPFTIKSGSPTHSLYVSNPLGHVGLGTSVPGQLLHLATASTPTIRLDQNIAPFRAWDIGGSDTSFFVKDVTNGSAVPFRVSAGAPANSLHIAANGFIGSGTPAPTAPIHIARDNGTAQMKVIEENSTVAARHLIVLENPGNTFFTINDTSTTGASWQLANFSTSTVDGFAISRQGDGINELVIKDNGDVHIVKDLRVTQTVHAGHFIDTVPPSALPDYVFDSGYLLMPLAELAAYVQRERHLPNVPGAQEMARDGLNLGELQMRLLEKIEELTLYVIAQDQQIIELRARLDERDGQVGHQQGPGEEPALIDELLEHVAGLSGSREAQRP